MPYAIISLGGKQYRVNEGERLLVDRVSADEGATLTLSTLLVGGDGDTRLSPDGVTVTARVVQHVLGEKVRIGKYRRRTGYRRHTGHRSKLSRIEIEAIGQSGRAAAKAAPPAREAAERPADAAPAGYAGLKVGEVAGWAADRDVPELEAALAYEQAHGARKGAVSALEAAIAKQGGD